MDFGSLPPEVNSARMYTGAGPATLLAASASWDSLAAELLTTAAGYQSVITGLTDESWIGPSSMSMEAAVAPYLAWMTVTAAQCDQAAAQATAAASAYEAAYAMTVPPPLVLTNRVQIATLVATNLFGQNTPAIMATEAEYSEMWAQDATAMYTYAANSAVASTFKSFASPPQTTNSSGLAAQAGTATQTTGTQSQSALMSAVSQALQGLSTPASSSTLGGASGLASTGASAPTSALSSLTGTSGKSAGTAGLSRVSPACLAASVITAFSMVSSMWPASAAMPRVWELTSAASVSTSAVPAWTSTACRWISRAWVRSWELKGEP